MIRALVRSIPDSFVDALGQEPGTRIDPAVARRQHSAYVAALSKLGVELLRVPADESTPDCVFVEDRVVTIGEAVVLTRSAAPSRDAERAGILSAMSGLDLEPVVMPPGACADGGDVLRLGKTLVVGRSARTNPAGLAFLRHIAQHQGWDVREVPLPAGTLHLKCYCSCPSPGVLVFAPSRLSQAAFSGLYDVAIGVPEDEAWAANTVGVSGRVLVGAGQPKTARLLGEAGLDIVLIDASEMAKADGSLTCMSAFLPPS